MLLSIEMKRLKVLVACEESQVVCKAFRERGHEAYSCDVQPCSGGHPEWHIQDDAVTTALRYKWDLMIGFPPCTYLSKVSNAFFNVEKYGEKAIERIRRRELAKVFFRALWNAPIEKIAIENPVGFMNSEIRPRQIIHPYYFGDPEQKATCLWLKNLPRLNGIPGVKKPAPKYIGKSGNAVTWSENLINTVRCHKERAKIRSKTFPGIARAMAEQWSELLTQPTTV
jgi:site-specific DNA-cytosine methylase